MLQFPRLHGGPRDPKGNRRRRNDHRRGFRRLTGPRQSPGFAVRAFRPDDLPALHGVEIRASTLFADHGYPEVGAEPPPIDEFGEFLRANTVHVAVDAGDAPIGYAVSGEVDGIWWLKELGVDPAVMRQGAGTALLNAVSGHARAAGYGRIGLSTFRDIPFNAPFYARRGWRTVDPDTVSAALRARFLEEVPDGVSPGDRVLMVLQL
ncbi:GNAT family N-acetyltransferase [Oricola indica]|uniref:GNAT family N-acetyltransferase n=1 Tax=Oricola indica TaxID=2872591 RepID=UPI001CBA9F65|nr:GNAT family N-acetyltransferase [Oricola indica]